MSKTIEQTYQKKTPKEHILLRPDTYIGAIDKDVQSMYVWDDSKEKIVQKSISYVPGLYKIFDEILVNAADNKMRDKSMNTLKVTISKENNEISILNNGKGIPIQIHAVEKVYVPELIFGHLLTGSNYDDKEKKITGGRNGYGAKLCNIFSTEFTVETADKSIRKRYLQRFSRNMDITDPPVIEKYNGEEFTKITFRPDLKRFNMTELDEDIISLLKKRVYDMCGTLRNVKVYLNDSLLPVHSFSDYVKLYLTSEEKIVHSVVNDRWEVAFVVSEDQFGQVSFVNSISTSKGGTHVNHVVEQLIDPILEAIKKKDKTLDIKPIHIKNNMFIFINCLIENPAFDSQTKENLTLKVSSFGSRCSPMDSFVKEIIKMTPIVDRIVSFSRAKQSAQLKKTDGSKTSRITGIPKLEDANLAGTKRSSECTLILTEGDSAKTLAVAGLGVVGRDLYGVFPLRGKLLNVREANHKQIMENAEISAIKKIIGLQHGKVYDDVSSLRYGHIMIMTDQDHDGSHIKGLIINFLDHFFPSLLRIPSFLLEFITPIIRATKKNETRDFFTIPEYETFKVDNEGWSIKYYKGLGTSTPKDAKQYFSDLKKHVKSFMPVNDTDRSLIDLAFNKKKADERKNWLGEFVPGTYLDQSQQNISITDFINRELILFSMADNVRSIPSVMDGLKPGQRKVLFSCFKRNLKNEIKVAQLFGYVAEQSAYHHGEQSLCATIVNMAQDFVGSNNINLLLPIGSFGSRLQGGKDAASSRYIYTSLNPLTRMIFSEHDDPILNYLDEDNMRIEPEFYLPVIPMVLVNGADGIGTGWSTNVPNFSPLDVIKNIRKLLNNESMEEMLPYYRNFRGAITQQGSGRYIIEGIYEQITDSTLEILELPVGTWTQNYKEYLESLVQNGIIKDYKEYHTEKKVNFHVIYNTSFPLKLSTFINTSNMVCFHPSGKIKKYETPLEIVQDFYIFRLQYYDVRKTHRVNAIKEELNKLENRVRFINYVISSRLKINNRPNDEIIKDLESFKFDRLDNFEYLLGMKISSLTKEKVEKLTKEYEDKKRELDILMNKSAKDLWKEDLDKFEEAYIKIQREEQSEYDSEVSKKSRKPAKASVKSQNSFISKVFTDKKTLPSVKKIESDKEAAKKSKEKKPKKDGSSVEKKSKKSESSKKSKVKIELNSSLNRMQNDEEPVIKKQKMEISKARNLIESDSSSEGENPWDKYKN